MLGNRAVEDLVDAIIVGAGPAGLAVGACLRRAGIAFEILERSDRVGSSWHRHYERLHLHTDKRNSGLPYVPFPKRHPRYPARLEVVEYLEDYAKRFELGPRFGESIARVQPRDGGWSVRTESGAAYAAKAVVIATGFNAVPNRPLWPGMDAFAGEILHSSEYRSGAPFTGRDVLVVGFGNSGGEIAIDLCEQGARAALAIRSPINILPRELLGIPILSWSIVLDKLPAAVADAIAKPLLSMAVGDPTKLGLRRLPFGPFTQIERRARIPLIDVGTLKLIRDGHVRVHGDVARFVRGGVIFADGSEARFDAVILATGFRPRLDRLVDHSGAEAVLDRDGAPKTDAPDPLEPLPGLFVCGFRVVPTGMLREIGLEAKRIAARIAERHGSRARPS